MTHGSGDGSVTLAQTGYIDKLVETFLPNGVPDKFTSAMTPAGDDLPRLVNEAVESESAPRSRPCLFFLTSSYYYYYCPI